jgi:hypothetical protein
VNHPEEEHRDGRQKGEAKGQLSECPTELSKHLDPREPVLFVQIFSQPAEYRGRLGNVNLGANIFRLAN